MMTRGTVAVGDDESHAGSGIALVLYDAEVATLVDEFALEPLPTLGDTTGFFDPLRPCDAGDVTQVRTARLRVLRDAARRANAYAVVVEYIVAHAAVDVVIPAGLPSLGLQRLPSVVTANADCVGPTMDKVLPGAGTIT